MVGAMSRKKVINGFSIYLNCTHSVPAKLLFEIGLRKYPKLSKLLEIISNLNPALRKKALKFLLKHFDDEYRISYQEDSQADIPFIPVEGESELSTISMVSEQFR
jgi:hypothetical protein